MITPVGITVEDYCEAIRTGVSHARMTFSGGTVLTDDDFEQGGIVVRDYMNSDTDLTFGTASSTEVTASILHSAKTDALDWTEEFTLEFGVEINNATDWITVGYFTGARPQKAYSDVITFVAYDRMSKFEKIADDWIDTIEYPCTLGDIYDSLCAYVGVTNESGDEIASNLNRVYDDAPFAAKGINCRRVLQWIAEACGCYAKVMANGNIKLIWFGDCTEDYSLILDNIFSLDVSKYTEKSKRWMDLEDSTWEDLEEYTWADLEGYYQPTKVNAVKIYNTGANYTNVVPYSAIEYNFYPIVDNPFVLSETRSVETNAAMNIFSRLSDFGQYTPATVNAVGNWLIEAGDIVNFEYEANTFINLPIFNRTIRWNGSTTCIYETTGNVERPILTDTAKEELHIGSVSQEIAKQVVDNIGDTVYVKKTGIIIDEDGIDISGAKSVAIHSGGNFDVDSDNFKLDSDTGEMISGEWHFNDEGVYLPNDDDATIFIIGSKEFPANTEGIKLDPTGKIQICSWEMGYYFINDIRIEMNRSYEYEWMRVWYGGGQTPSIHGVKQIGYFDDVVTEMMCSNHYTEAIYPYSYEVHGYNNYNDNNNYGSDITYGTIGSSHRVWEHIYGATIHYTTLSQISSRELKEDIKALPSVGETIDKLKPVSFKYKGTGRKRFGLIHEETIEILPEICIGDKNSSAKEKGINYTELVPLLLKEIQDLRGRVSELEQIIKERGN